MAATLFSLYCGNPCVTACEQFRQVAKRNWWENTLGHRRNSCALLHRRLGTCLWLLHQVRSNLGMFHLLTVLDLTDQRRMCPALR